MDGWMDGWMDEWMRKDNQESTIYQSEVCLGQWTFFCRLGRGAKNMGLNFIIIFRNVEMFFNQFLQIKKYIVKENSEY